MTRSPDRAWLARMAEVAAREPVVRVTLIRTEGSAPREAGAAMLVTAEGQEGTIGGGSLEHEATLAARALIEDVADGEPGPWRREVREYPLGPALCQCCGGYVWALLEVYGPGEATTLAQLAAGAPRHGALIAHPLVSGPPLALAADRRQAGPWHNAVSATIQAMLSGNQPAEPAIVPGTQDLPAWFLEPAAPAHATLYLYGAGHVGREIVRVMEGLPFDIVWVDTAPARFPGTVRAGVEMVADADPAAVAGEAPPGAWHLVMTFSHPLDEAICAALLARGDFAYLGLIGSQTKRARFLQRFRATGLPEADIARLVCPIGAPGTRGKAPAAIAVSVAADLVARHAAAPPMVHTSTPAPLSVAGVA